MSFFDTVRAIAQRLGLIQRPRPTRAREQIIPPTFGPSGGGTQGIFNTFDIDVAESSGEILYVPEHKDKNGRTKPAHWEVYNPSGDDVRNMFEEASSNGSRRFFTIVVEGVADEYRAGDHTSDIRDDGTRVLSYAKRDIEVFRGLDYSDDPTEQINHMLTSTEPGWLRVDKIHIIDREDQF